LMGMPDTAVDKNGPLLLPDYDVRAPWQSTRVQAESDTPAEEPLAQNKFRPRVIARCEPLPSRQLVGLLLRLGRPDLIFRK